MPPGLLFCINSLIFSHFHSEELKRDNDKVDTVPGHMHSLKVDCISEFTEGHASFFGAKHRLFF
jgi:hypothetical protein